jgi:hypothetical protein
MLTLNCDCEYLICNVVFFASFPESFFSRLLSFFKIPTMELPSFTGEIQNVLMMNYLDEVPIIPIAEGYTAVRRPTRRHPWRSVRIKWLNQDGYVENFFNCLLNCLFPKILGNINYYFCITF